MAISDDEYLDWLHSGAPGVLLFEASYTKPWYGIYNTSSKSWLKSNVKASNLPVNPEGESFSLTWRGRIAALEDKKEHLVYGSTTKRLSVGWELAGNVWAKFSDGTTTVSGSMGTPAVTAAVHCVSWAVDRAAGIVTCYVDGVATSATLDISSVTGDLDDPVSMLFDDSLTDSYAYDVIINYATITAQQVADYVDDYEKPPLTALQHRWRGRAGYAWEENGSNDFSARVQINDYGPHREDAGANGRDVGGTPPYPTFTLEAADDGGAQSLYLSMGGYISAAADTPASTPYADAVVAPPDYSQVLPAGLMGVAKTTLGAIRLRNHDGRYNPLIGADWTTDNAFTLLYGDPSWPRSDFRTRLAGVINNVTATADEIILSLRSTQQQLFGEVATGNPTIYGAAAVMAPVLIAGKTYEAHDAGTLASISTAWDDGVSVGFTTDLPNGRLTLNSTPVGHVTCAAAKTLSQRPGPIIQEVLEDHTPLTTGDLDTTAFTNFYGAFANHGLVIVGEMNVERAVEQMAAVGFGAVYTGRDGKVTVRNINHTDANVATYGADEILAVQLVEMIYPVGDYAIKYQPNWGPSNSELAKSVTGEDAVLNKFPYTSEIFSDSVKNQWAEAVDTEFTAWGHDNAFPSITGQVRWYARHRNYFSAPVEKWQVDLRFPAVTVDLLDWISLLFLPHWPHARAAQVVGIKDGANNTSTLTVLMR